jgi:hypothetical protein
MRSAHCLRRRLLGSTCVVRNLVGIGRSRNLGYSTGGHRHFSSRRFFHLPGYATAAAFNRQACIRVERQPIGQSRDADRVCAADDHASTGSCNRVSFELVLSRANDPAGRALSSFYISVWHAYVHALVRDPRQQRCCRCTLFSRILQSWRFDRWPDAVRFCLDPAGCGACWSPRQRIDDRRGHQRNLLKPKS